MEQLAQEKLAVWLMMQVSQLLLHFPARFRQVTGTTPGAFLGEPNGKIAKRGLAVQSANPTHHPDALKLRGWRRRIGYPMSSVSFGTSLRCGRWDKK
ncbi:hypothetical protein [Rhizobium sp.]|uniref:hypothetical protein n=1 Tax=Rhizobium sp. TaxID=391 RepID=UPI0028999625